MKVMALTGGIGSGKSTICSWIAQQGIATLDSDQIARQLVMPKQPGLAEIVETFGADILQSNGQLDRAQLRDRIFTDPQAKRQLEAILHPKIRAETQRQLAQFAAEKRPLVVIEIPLLAETGVPDYIDQVIVLDLPPAVQIERVMNRDHCSHQQVSQILAQQASRAERLAIADHVIDASQSLTQIKAQLQPLLMIS